MKRMLWVAIVVLFLLPEMGATDLPKAPPGYAWEEIPELKAALLKPEGWFYQREQKDGTLAFFITKEDISKGGEFQTGLTVNVFHLKKDSAVERGEAMISNMAAEHHVKGWRRTHGPFDESGCELRDTDATGTIVMQALAVANPKTNTLYLFTFEAPAESWDAAWKIGKPILDSLALDDEI
jgi:hypothetical protein